MPNYGSRTWPDPYSLPCAQLEHKHCQIVTLPSIIGPTEWNTNCHISGQIAFRQDHCSKCESSQVNKRERYLKCAMSKKKARCLSQWLTMTKYSVIFLHLMWVSRPIFIAEKSGHLPFLFDSQIDLEPSTTECTKVMHLITQQPFI